MVDILLGCLFKWSCKKKFSIFMDDIGNKKKYWKQKANS